MISVSAVWCLEASSYTCVGWTTPPMYKPYPEYVQLGHPNRETQLTFTEKLYRLYADP